MKHRLNLVEDAMIMSVAVLITGLSVVGFVSDINHTPERAAAAKAEVVQVAGTATEARPVFVKA
jgi:hypothetical protein